MFDIFPWAGHPFQAAEQKFLTENPKMRLRQLYIREARRRISVVLRPPCLLCQDMSSVFRTPSPNETLDSTLERTVECIQALADQLPDGEEMYRDERLALKSFITTADSLRGALGETDESTFSSLDMCKAIGSDFLTIAPGRRTLRNYARSAPYSVRKSSTEALADPDIEASEWHRHELLVRLAQDVIEALDELKAMYDSLTENTKGIPKENRNTNSKRNGIGKQKPRRRERHRNRIVPAAKRTGSTGNQPD